MKWLAMIQRISLSMRLSVLLLLVGAAYLTKEAIQTHHAVHRSFEVSLGTRTKLVARTAARIIDGASHQSLAQAYLNRQSNTENATLKKMHRLLRHLKKINEIQSDIYTFFQPEWDQNKLITIATSHPKSAIGQNMPITPEARTSLRKGKATHTQLYRSQGGLWISAYAPIKNKSGRVVGGVAVHYQADKEIAAANNEMLNGFLFPSAIILFFSLAAGTLLSRSITRPLQKLKVALEQIETGNLDVQSGKPGPGEVGTVTKVLNKTLQSLKKDKTKPPHKIQLGVERIEGDHLETPWLWITCKDDSGSIDLQALREQAKSLDDEIDEADSSDFELLQHLLEPEFDKKTKDPLPLLDLPALGETVKKLGGTIEIQSNPNEGTLLTLIVPYKDLAEKESDQEPVADAA